MNIAELSPYIEGDGTIRVKFRLKQSNLCYKAKQPILLAAKHPLLLEREYHDNLHEGTEYVRNMFQREYRIIWLRNKLRKVNSRCITCRHRNANPINEAMAELPRDWLDEHVFQFTHTRLYYFGLIKVKFLGRILKRWCCLFTRLTTRAVHIEVAQSLDIKLSKYHLQRQGHKLHWSSQQTECILGEWEKAKLESNWEKFCGNSTLSPIWWNLGRIFQCFKKVTIAILNKRSVTNKLLSTTMCLVEQTLNARSLTAVSDDPEEMTALTPKYFLLGPENASSPFMPSSERYHNLRKSFERAQAYANMF